ncbi:MAG: hypothetical protein QM796_07025 [Chthoniobacteraceae bacterium]
MNSLIGNIPKHQYVYVDSSFTHTTPIGFIPAVWFGLVAFPGRLWGCNVMLESGAIYRNLPPHAIAFDDKEGVNWTPHEAQFWSCYGYDFSTLEYDYLSGLGCAARIGEERELKHFGRYLFTVAPIGDAFSAVPEQAKEFQFIRLNNNRLTIQPTDRVVFFDSSFQKTAPTVFPADLKRQTEIFNCD